MCGYHANVPIPINVYQMLFLEVMSLMSNQHHYDHYISLQTFLVLIKLVVAGLFWEDCEKQVKHVPVANYPPFTMSPLLSDG